MGFWMSACKPAHEARMEKLERLAKSSVNAANLQAWAVQILKSNTCSLALIPSNMIPADVRLLGKSGFQFDASILPHDSNCIYFVSEIRYFTIPRIYFGLFGLCVGQTNYVPKPDDCVYTKWIPGVYFWFDPNLK